MHLTYSCCHVFQLKKDDVCKIKINVTVQEKYNHINRLSQLKQKNALRSALAVVCDSKINISCQNEMFFKPFVNNYSNHQNRTRALCNE